MRSIYRTAWAFVAKHWKVLLLAAVLLEALPFLFQTASSSGDAGVLFLIAYYMHRFVLFGEDVSGWGFKRSTPSRKHTIWRFMLASLTMAICLILVVGGVGVRLSGQGVEKDVLFGFLLIVGFVAQYVLLVIFGTALPAAAAGDRFGPITTLGRVPRTALSIAGGLLAGPVLCAIPLLAVQIFVATQISRLDGGPFGEVAAGTMMRMGGFFLTALAVAVLCRAYRKVAPPGFADQTPA